jgi:cell division protein FtsI/penicillin-binding protein 2
VQRAAQAAVDKQDLPTMLVAIQPSTGDLLAVAQNSSVDAGPVALQGQFAPGSTFKVATATALLDAGTGIGTIVPCPGSATVGQRTVRNADFDLGDVPLRTAFAQSCNTSFALAAADLPLDALPRAANQLGLGADFVIPGIDTEVGGVPVAVDAVQQVENSIGQGQVQVSPFGLAMMSATVAAGRAVTPRLWPDRATEVTTGYEAPSPGVIRSLRTMMREVVTGGRATELAGLGRVYGKTGTAETTGSAHGWFTGYRDDLAFAVLVQDGESSSTAVAVTSSFLAGLG